MIMSETSSSAGKSGGLSVLAIVGIVVVALLAVIGIIIAILVGYQNTANRYENAIKATYANNQNILSNYTLKLMEAAGVTSQYADDFGKLVQTEMQSRYGDPATRTGAVMNWIQERQMNYDSSLYTKLQALIEAGRNEFANNQTRLLDQKREYETALGDIPTGPFMKMWGYPRIVLADYKTVNESGVITTFETGVAKPVEMFPKK
jgi:hypothetical protein